MSAPQLLALLLAVLALVIVVYANVRLGRAMRRIQAIYEDGRDA